MSVNEIRDILLENLYKHVGFSKENSYYSKKHQRKKYLQLFATKLAAKISYSSNDKERYQSFIRRKNKKSVKQWKIISQQQKYFENSIIADVKSVIIEHPKRSHKLSKTIRKTEKVSQIGSNSSLHSDTKKLKIFWRKKIWK